MGVTIPKEKVLDNTISILAEGYEFLSNRRRSLDTDYFETRVLGQRATCVWGEDAVKLFYDNERFKREGVIPKRIQKSLFGDSGVQLLDDEEHRHRKQMFMSIMTHEKVGELSGLIDKYWNKRLPDLEEKGTAVLFDEAQEVLVQAACEWAGIPLEEKDIEKRALQMGRMVDAIGGVGSRFQRGKQSRQDAEEWIEGIVDQIRAGEYTPPAGTAAAVFSSHTDLSGQLLDVHTAAVEILNIVRPIVAVSVFITFGALALYEHPEIRRKLIEGDRHYHLMFVQEVRRFYPFAPFLAAKTRKAFTWKGIDFPKDRLVVLDFYGTNHDPAVWEDPDSFKPERFEGWKESPFNFIPQGGGDYHTGHRCAGEWATVAVIQASMAFLTKQIAYDVPEQDLEYSMIRIPSLPKSGFIMTHIRRA